MYKIFDKAENRYIGYILFTRATWTYSLIRECAVWYSFTLTPTWNWSRCCPGLIAIITTWCCICCCGCQCYSCGCRPTGWSKYGPCSITCLRGAWKVDCSCWSRGWCCYTLSTFVSWWRVWWSSVWTCQLIRLKWKNYDLLDYKWWTKLTPMLVNELVVVVSALMLLMDCPLGESL